MPDPLLFRMPSLGADMDAGTLVKWVARPGRAVHRGDVIAEVETHKGVIEVEVFADGVVRRLLVDEGARVPVGTPLAELDPTEEDLAGPAVAPAPPEPPAPAIAAPEPEPPAPAVVAPGPSPAAQPWVRSSPAARRHARERGVDLATVRGTGRHGAVVRADVDRAIGTAAAPASPASPSPRRPTGPDPNAAIRTAIAAAMSRANRDIPHYHLAHDIDLRVATTRLLARNAARPPAERVLPGVLLVWAVAQALRRFPDLNGYWEDGRFRPAAGIHPGIAIALRGGGLVAPCLHDADRLDLDALMAAMADLVARARAGRLRSSEVADPTITITSLGDTGVELVHGVIYPPQVALVGFGRIGDRPVAVEGMLAVHPVVTATLAGDHRAGDGHRGAQFLIALDRLLQDPP